MRMRPVDGSGDMLPVQSFADMLTGADAAAVLAEDRLKLLAGDWWENPGWGCEILRMMQESRMTEKDAQAVSTYLASFVRETPGVLDVRNEKWEIVDSRLRWSCTAVTEYGKAEVRYESG